MQSSGLFAQHPLQWILHHHTADEETAINCPSCGELFTGKVRPVYEAFKDHVYGEHYEQLEDCGCCGGLHFPSFAGDCREDWDRF